MHLVVTTNVRSKGTYTGLADPVPIIKMFERLRFGTCDCDVISKPNQNYTSAPVGRVNGSAYYLDGVLTLVDAPRTFAATMEGKRPNAAPTSIKCVHNLCTFAIFIKMFRALVSSTLSAYFYIPMMILIGQV